jgi:signal transduction histidine kinase
MSSASNNRETEEMAYVSNLLLHRKETILRRWAELARAQLPAAKEQSKPALYNALPDFIDQIVTSLSPFSPFQTLAAEAGREHGEQRANLSTYSLKQIMEEYIVLRDTMIEELERTSPIPEKAREIIFHYIVHGMTEAAAEYSRIQDSIREQFVAILTHDLKNPLSAAKTCAQMIPRVLNHPEKCQTLASRAVLSIKRIETMIQDLLDTFQVRAGKVLPVHIVPDDLRRVAQDAIDELSTVHGSRFIFHSPLSVPAEFCSDGICRSIENLANNAVKYGDPQKPITITIRDLESDRVQISVHNFGNPLIAEEQAKLFQPFHRSPFAESSGQKGWGLGLTLVQGVIKAHRGRVTVRSFPKEGTTFTIEFPKSQVDAKAA